MTLKDRLNMALTRLKDRGSVMADGARPSQAGLARHVGIKAPSVSDWFRGETYSIEGENLLRAAEYLRVRPEWLATGAGPMERDAKGSGANVVAMPPAAWPFNMVDRKRWEACDTEERGYVQSAINRALSECESIRAGKRQVV